MRERDVDRALTRELKKLGLTSIKLTSLGRYGTGGWPDRLILLPRGRAVFVELKAPGEVPTARQFRALDRLRDLGYLVTWSDNPRTLVEWLRMIVIGA